MYFPGDIWNIIKEYAIDCNLLWHISRTDSIDRLLWNERFKRVIKNDLKKTFICRGERSHFNLVNEYYQYEDPLGRICRELVTRWVIFV